MLLQSRKQKSIQLDQHTVRIQGKKLILDLCICNFDKSGLPEALMCPPCIQKNTKGKNKTVKYLDIFATNAPGRN